MKKKKEIIIIIIIIILAKYNINIDSLPKSVDFKQELLYEKIIKELENIINITSWHKIQIYNRNYNKK